MQVTVEFLLLAVGLLGRVQLHGLAGLETGERRPGRFPRHTQRAEVIKLPALLVKRRHVQLRVPIIRHRDLKESSTTKEEHKNLTHLLNDGGIN